MAAHSDDSNGNGGHGGGNRHGDSSGPGNGDGGGRPLVGRAREVLVRGSVAQRVRFGLTGLAAIFLIVLVAAAGLKPARSLAPQGAQGEPLAVLGVAPGAGPATSDASGPGAAAPATPPPAGR